MKVQPSIGQLFCWWLHYKWNVGQIKTKWNDLAYDNDSVKREILSVMSLSLSDGKYHGSNDTVSGAMII